MLEEEVLKPLGLTKYRSLLDQINGATLLAGFVRRIGVHQ